MNSQRRKAIQEAIDLLLSIGEPLERAISIISDAASEEREAYDNLSEGLQASERGERMGAAAEALEGVQGALEEFALDDLIADLQGAME